MAQLEMASGLPETRIAGDGTESGVVLGHHKTAGSSAPYLLLYVYHSGHLQPVCGGLHDCHQRTGLFGSAIGGR